MAKNFAALEEEVEKLHPVETFAYHVARVPWWTMKVRKMLIMKTATELEGEIKTSLETVITASKEFLQSKRFKKVLVAILTVDHFLKLEQRRDQRAASDLRSSRSCLKRRDGPRL